MQVKIEAPLLGFQDEVFWRALRLDGRGYEISLQTDIVIGAGQVCTKSPISQTLNPKNCHPKAASVYSIFQRERQPRNPGCNRQVCTEIGKFTVYQIAFACFGMATKVCMWWVGDDLLRPDVNFLGITAQAGGIDVWAVLGCRFTH